MQKPTIDQVIAAYQKQGYRFFDVGAYNLNIFGIRSNQRTAGAFDDYIGVIYRETGTGPLIMKIWAATTDPGDWELKVPSFQEAIKGGTAILAPGQYIAAYALGQHGVGNWRHDALRQVKPVRAFRDKNKDGTLDTVETTITSGLYGINIHAAKRDATTMAVANWSAGCQVFSNWNEHKNEFMGLAKRQNSALFSYTLFTENQVCGA